MISSTDVGQGEGEGEREGRGSAGRELSGGSRGKGEWSGGGVEREEGRESREKGSLNHFFPLHSV